MSEFVNPFILPVNEYKREINPYGDYKNSAVKYLMLVSGDDEVTCRAAVENMLGKGGRFEMKDRPVEYFERGENRKRERKVGTFLQYVGESVVNGDTIAPTYTTYMHPSVKRSILAIDIDDKIRLRSKAKKTMFKARADKDEFMAKLMHLEQTQRKRSNNSLSGAANSTGTPLANKTSHSSLTSTCRITSSYGNANNEKLLSGNRHYYYHDLVINDIIAITTHTDYTLLESVMTRFNLHYPDVEEVMQCITYSTDLYWISNIWLNEIRVVVDKLNPLERAAYVYTGDLYQIKRLNESFMREFLEQLSTRVDCDDFPDAMGCLKTALDSHSNLAQQLCEEHVRGLGKNYDKMTPRAISTLAATIEHIKETVTNYSDFIKVIMVSNNAPTCVGMFPESLRRSAITSDTDSTIFTVQDWVIWFCSSYSFTEKAIGIQATMTFLASSAISHILARMSANLGVETDKLFRIEMKSEFRFDVFVPTMVAKTYYASIGCQEGSVFEHPEMEIKGVMLKSSTNPPDINQKAKLMMQKIMDTVKQGERISLMSYIQEIAEIEKSIIESVLRGETKYLKGLNINDGEAYTADPEESPYQNHTFWQETFGKVYGHIKPPPYKTAKISLKLSNGTALKKWLDSIENKDLSASLRSYFASKGRTAFNTFYAPDEVLERFGVPKEIGPVIDGRKIASQLCKAFYLILETLGLYIHQKDVRRMAMDILPQ